MSSPEEYRHSARMCMDLAAEAQDLYAREALMELAAEFSAAADKLERGGSGSGAAPLAATKHSPSR